MLPACKYLFAFSLSILMSSCSNGHRDFIVSYENGIKKEIETFNYGTGGGFTGSEPRLTKQTIKKYNLKNQIFYFSQKEIHRDGCIYSTPVWEILSIDSMGIRKEYRVKEDFATIKIKDGNNKLIKEITQKRSEFITPDWFDKDEQDY